MGILTLFLQFRCLLENTTPNPNTNLPTAKDLSYNGTNMADVTHQKTHSQTVFKASDVSIKREYAPLLAETNQKTISNPYRNDFEPLYFYII